MGCWNPFLQSGDASGDSMISISHSKIIQNQDSSEKFIHIHLYIQ